MGKNRKVHEVVEELMTLYRLGEKELAEKAGVSELVIRNYLTGLNKDSRNYARLKEKVKGAFSLGDEFFDESHVSVSVPKSVQSEEKKADEPVKTKTIPKRKKKTITIENASKDNSSSSVDEGTQLVFDIDGKISEEEKQEVDENHAKADKAEKADQPDKTNKTGKVKAAGKTAEKEQANAVDSLISAIRTSGSKAKLSGKKKDITSEAAKDWASKFEQEIKESVEKAFDVLKKSLADNFSKEETKPVYANKKIAELVELASKAKEDDLNLVIAMLKKITR